ncbi:MAG TPA: hypothetical protein VIX86_00865 [Streptosporangiaceae bacterium]
MSDCGGGLRVRPTVVNVICQTNDITARSLTWSAWGRPFTIGSGTAVVDLCAFEDCHTGSYQNFPIVVIASRIERCGKATQVYSRLQYVFVGPQPFAGLPASMNFSNFMAGSGRPGPGNQTVSLSC